MNKCKWYNIGWTMNPDTHMHQSYLLLRAPALIVRSLSDSLLLSRPLLCQLDQALLQTGLLTPLGRHLSTVLSQLEHTADWWYLSSVLAWFTLCLCGSGSERTSSIYSLWEVCAVLSSSLSSLPLWSALAASRIPCSRSSFSLDTVACRALIWGKSSKKRNIYLTLLFKVWGL